MNGIALYPQECNNYKLGSLVGQSGTAFTEEILHHTRAWDTMGSTIQRKS